MQNKGDLPTPLILLPSSIVIHNIHHLYNRSYVWKPLKMYRTSSQFTTPGRRGDTKVKARKLLEITVQVGPNQRHCGLSVWKSKLILPRIHYGHIYLMPANIYKWMIFKGRTTRLRLQQLHLWVNKVMLSLISTFKLFYTTDVYWIIELYSCISKWQLENSS